jgi:NAD(P)-dependent dehydrogenase (short-subunit alcohol dehydrogenase family)
MNQNIVITGAERGFGFALTEAFLTRGWRVFAGQFLADLPDLGKLKLQYPKQLFILPLDVGTNESVEAFAQSVAKLVDHIDMFVNNAAIYSGWNELRSEINYDLIQRTCNVNAIGALRMVNALLPLMDGSELKRLCFVSSEAGSIALSKRKSEFGYCMSKAALNMAVKIMHNHLRPQGYTFRLYHPGWMKSSLGGGGKSTTGDLEPEEAAAFAVPFFTEGRADEDRLAMIDYKGKEWPF